MLRKPALAALLTVLAVLALPGGSSASTTNTRIVSGPSGAISTDSATFAFTSPEDGGFQCRLDWGEWEACSSPTTYPSLADGLHRFEVRTLNRPHHHDPTPAVAFFCVEHRDTEPPVTTIVSGPSGTIATAAAIFGFESSEAGSFECRMDSDLESAWGACAPPQLYSDLPDGPHGFEVRASDEAGNTDPTPASAAFATDTTAPETTISSGPSGTISSAAASFEFTATEGGGFQCRLDSSDSGAWSMCSSPRSYASLADGSHSFEVRASDPLGNTDPTPADAGFTVYTGPPKPLAGETLDLEAQKGSVQLQCPGEDSYSQLVGFKQVPVGCLVNTRNGVVDITASKGSSGDLQNADFWGGVFVVSQQKGDDQEVELKLAGKRMCERRGGKGEARASRGGHSGRKLWGSGKGNYSTSGSYGSATVRGTTWLVVDRCDASTLIKVAEGTVAVRDFVKETSLTLTTGQQYIAKASIPRLDPDALP
ncbi:MAG: hypothetical protein ACJ75T_01735 [Solirubrobacterales bacterium]